MMDDTHNNTTQHNNTTGATGATRHMMMIMMMSYSLNSSVYLASVPDHLRASQNCYFLKLTFTLVFVISPSNKSLLIR
jgi:hypothetical protein